MSLQYIRDYYGVPARRGGRVRFTYLKPQEGTIVGSRNAHLKVRLDGDTRTVQLHPTWCVEYLDEGGAGRE